MIGSDLTVGELKRYLSAYRDDDPVVFQHIITPDGAAHYRLRLYRIDNRGVGENGVCHFEWNPLDDEDRFI